jgi:hypoxia up-regulated 1
MKSSHRSASTWRLVALAALVVAGSVSGAAVIGIDFSSAFVKVAVAKPRSPFEIVINPQSKRKTPAALGFYRSERLFGADAESLLARRPELVFQGGQMLLGSSFESERVREHLGLKFTAHALEQGNRSEPVFVVPDDADAHPTFGRIAMTPEMYTAQLLAYFKRMTETLVQQPVSGAVITVPSFWTHSERTALRQASEMAGLHLLRVVEENTAAAVQFGVDRVYPNNTLVMVYNMGASSTQATLFMFSSYKARDGKLRGTADVIGKGWSETLGGNHFDRILVDHVVEIFNKKHGAKVQGGDIRQSPRAMAKLFRSVTKLKEVLSANAEFPLIIESLIDEIDFRTTISRETFLSLSAHLLAQAAQPALDACSAAGVKPEDVEIVEIIGGGVRVPAVQDVLRKALKRDERPPAVDPTTAVAAGEAPVNIPALGIHLNGDEAAAFGGAFIAANLSKSFRVRPVGMDDTLPFGVSVRISDAAQEDSTPQEPVVRSLPPYSKLGRTHLLRIYDWKGGDLVVSLSYNASVTPLPQGTSASLGTYLLSGLVDSEVAEACERTGQLPNVTVRVTITADGTIKLGSASASAEELVTPEPEAAEEENATVAEKNATETVPVPKKQKHRVLLQSHVQGVGEQVRLLSSDEVISASDVMTQLQRFDDDRKELETARNDLETFVSLSRDLESEEEEVFGLVTTEEQRTELEDTLTNAEDWLYGDGSSASLVEVREKRAEADRVVGPIKHRIAEYKARPVALDKAQQLIDKAHGVIKSWTSTKIWVSVGVCCVHGTTVTGCCRCFPKRQGLASTVEEQVEREFSTRLGLLVGVGPCPGFLNKAVRGLVRGEELSCPRGAVVPRPRRSALFTPCGWWRVFSAMPGWGGPANEW